MMSSQKPIKKTRILELIGICLVIMALISAYGLYYTSEEYAKVTETQMNAGAYITGIEVSKNISDPGLDVDILVLNNASQLDVEVYLIEFRVYASDVPITTPSQLDYLGTVASSSGGDIVEAGTNYMYRIPLNIDPISDPYQKLVDTSPDGSGYFIVQGTVYYEISGPSELQNTIPFYFSGKLGVAP